MTEQLDLFDSSMTQTAIETKTYEAANDPMSLPAADIEPAAGFRLAPLDLLGRGTSQVESFKSYLMRLAHAHCYLTQDMVKLVGRHSVLADLPAKKLLGRYYDSNFSDASIARDWIPAVAARNGVRHLEDGLVSSWGSLLGKNRGSGSWLTRWCGHCLEDGQQSGAPYLPAAWSLGMVSACAIHGTVLESVCHHCGAGQTATGQGTRRFAMDAPGVCGTCGEWLGTVDPRTPGEPPRQIAMACEHDVEVAVQIGSLLARPMQRDESFGVHLVLQAACKRYFGGVMVNLADWIGTGKGSVHGWLAGSAIPEVGRLTQLAIKLRISLRDLVTGRCDDLPETLEAPKAGLVPRARSAPRAEEKRLALRAMISAEPDLSLREAARRIGISHRDVYYLLENEALQHSDARRQVQEQLRADRYEHAETAVLAKLTEVVGDGATVTVRELRAIAADRSPTLSYDQQQDMVYRMCERLAA